MPTHSRENRCKALGEGCKKHFDILDSSNMGALESWIDENMQFIDVSSTAKTETAWGVNPSMVLGQAMQITKPTVLLGGGFFDPSKTTGNDKPEPEESNISDYQRNVLVHEYNHARYNIVGHQPLFNEWKLADKGYEITGSTVAERDASAQKAVNQFIARDCR